MRAAFILLLLVLQAVAFQLPFQLPNFFEKSDTNIEQSTIHYSELDPSVHPINLSQYQDKYVITIKYGGDDDLKKTLLRPSAQKEFNFTKWGRSNTQQTIDIQIDAENMKKMIERFPSMEFQVLIEDLPQAVFETYPAHESFYNQSLKANEEMGGDIHNYSELFFKEYRDLKAIDSWLDLLQSTYPDVISLEEIGETFEHKKIKVVHFATPNDDLKHDEKKTIVITGGVHAREWISVSTTLYVMYQLIQLYETNPTSKALTNLNFLFIPVINPDGYEYTWTTDRLWRKNRQQTPVPHCFGIDIDHSYDYHWTKSSDWACGEEYSGEVPFEAFESRIWDQYLNETNAEHKIAGYIDLHSYSQEILYPYAYLCNQQPRDEENLLELAYGIARSIRLQLGHTYQVLPACIDKDADYLPDLGSGTSLDFMYHNRAYWAYQLKLRDTGGHGFLLPSKYIEPVGDEIYAAIKYFCKFILSDDR